MKFLLLLAAPALILSTVAPAAFPRHVKRQAAHPPRTEAGSKAKPEQPAKALFHPGEVRSTGTVTLSGQPINFDAVAGTLVVHAKDWEDTDALDADTASKEDKDKNAPKPEASMFYTAYFKQGAAGASRPITF